MKIRFTLPSSTQVTMREPTQRDFAQAQKAGDDTVLYRQCITEKDGEPATYAGLAPWEDHFSFKDTQAIGRIMQEHFLLSEEEVGNALFSVVVVED